MKNTYHFVKPKIKTTKLRRLLHCSNIPKHVCGIAFGKNHSHFSRMAVGLVIGVCGVVIAKSVGHSHNELQAYAGDAIGYGLHGIGLTPYIDYLTEVFEEV